MNSTKTLILRSVFFLFLLAFAVSSCVSGEEIRSADLIFVVENQAVAQDSMSKAIMEATGSEEVCATHVGIIEVSKDSIYVIDAAPRNGVSLRPLSEFVEEFITSDSHVEIMRLNLCIDAEAVIRKAKSFIGLPYDYAFLPDNDAIYCSELVQCCYVDAEGKPVFSSRPMNFQDDNGEYPEYWQSLFSKLGVPIPQGEPGTNPNDMMHDTILYYIPHKHTLL